jgi:hypothetical protein
VFGHDRGMNQTADRVVDALFAEHLLDPGSRPRAVEVVGAALGQPVAETPRGLPKLVEVVAYLGGALVLAAVVLFLGLQWDSFGFGSKVGLLGVATAVLVVAGLVAAHVGSRALLLDPAYDVRRRLAGSLLSGAAVTAGSLAGLVVDHADATTAFDWETLTGGAVMFAVAAVGYLRAKTAVGVLVMMGSLLAVVLTVSDRVDDVVTGITDGDGAGLLLVATGIAWLVVTGLGWFREGVVARVLGVGVVLVGAQVPVLDGTHQWLGYVLTTAAVVLGVAVYLARQSWPYLALAVVGVTLVVPEAISDWTEGSLGIVGGVLVTGVTLLAASFTGYRLRAESIA